MFLTKDSKELVGLSQTDLTNLLGGKGAGLAWMANQGVNVPPFVVFSTEVWAQYKKSPQKTLDKIASEIPKVLKLFNAQLGYVPLMSVRSGARVSCPGMMDTILNVGIDESTSAFWSERLGADCYSNTLNRLVTMYGSTARGLDKKKLHEGGLDYYQAQAGEFPDATGQLLGSIEAVFKSWDNDRAKFYRKMNNIPEDWGTAVVVQAMVFGNLNDKSGTGVLFTRDPDSGDKGVVGEFLINAQGEDVVDGSHTPMKLLDMVGKGPEWSDLYTELTDAVLKLEKAHKDVQDVEFTIEDGKLFILQTRNAKRSARAAVKIALDMLDDGLLSAAEAVKRVTPKELDLVMQPALDPKFTTPEYAKGIPACSGVVVGVPVFSAAAAIASKVPCILVSDETTPDDIEGMNAAVGILTMKGGSTSHAAVVARGMNKPCVVGVGGNRDPYKSVPKISIDGATGRVWLGEVPVIDNSASPEVTRYWEVLRAVTGHIPVLSSVPTKPLDEALYDARDVMFNVAKVAAHIKLILPMVKRLYIDVSTHTGVDADFFRPFLYNGKDGVVNDQNTLIVIEEILTALGIAEKEAEKIVLITGAEAAGKCPYTILQSIADLEDLVLAEGVATYNNPIKMTAAVKKVLAWRISEGLQFVSVGEYVKGSTCLISDTQAHQLLGA